MNKKIYMYYIFIILLFIINIFFLIIKLDTYKNYYLLYLIITFIISTILFIKNKTYLLKSIKKEKLNIKNIIIIETLGLYLLSTINMIIDLFYKNWNATYFQNVIFNLLLLFIYENYFSLSQIDSKIKKDLHNKILEVKQNEIFVSNGKITKGNCYIDPSLVNGKIIPVQKIENDNIAVGSKNITSKVEYEQNISIKNYIPINKINLLSINKKNKDTVLLIVALTILIALINVKQITMYKVSIMLRTFFLLAFPSIILLSKITKNKNISFFENNLIKCKNINLLKNVSKNNIVIFDKTGTLTNGLLTISKIYNYSTYSNKKLLEIAYHLSKYSSETVKYAFNNYFANSKITNIVLTKIKKLPGVGVTAEYKDKKIYIGNSTLIKNLKLTNNHELTEKKIFSKGEIILYIIEENKILGIISIGDTIKKDATKTIDFLKKEGYNLVMMSGDNKNFVDVVAQKLEIDTVISDITEDEKVEIIEDIQKLNKKVIYIGNGYNDIKALKTSDLGICLSNQEEIVLESDIAILDSDVIKIKKIFEFSKTYNSILNFIEKITFLYNILFVLLANILVFTKYFYIIGSIYLIFSCLFILINSYLIKKITLYRE